MLRGLFEEKLEKIGLSEKEFEACRTALAEAQYYYSNESNLFDAIDHYLGMGDLSLVTGTDGYRYAWYADHDGYDILIGIDNNTKISIKEPFTQLFSEADKKDCIRIEKIIGID